MIDILSVTEDHEFENNDYLKNVLESFYSMVDLHDSLHTSNFCGKSYNYYCARPKLADLVNRF